MTSGPLNHELILDSVKKDLSIENMQKAMAQYKAIACEWIPQISIDENADNGNAVQFKLVVGDPSVPQSIQGLTYTLTKKDVVYLSDGNALIENVAENLATLYESLLRNVLREQARHLAANIRREGKA